MKFLKVFMIFLLTISVQLKYSVGLKRQNDADRAKSLLHNAKLVMTLKSKDDTLVRTVRGSEDAALSETESRANNSEKRNKNGGHKKLNRNSDINAANNGGRKSHIEKKPFGSGNEQHQQQPQQHTGRRQQFGNRQPHGNNQHNKQRQLLKAQQHQEQQHHGNKRKQNLDIEEHGNENSKSQSTCRYTKSAWSDCDKKTNTHSRTLTLKKGDSNCLPTRTIQKKCKKSCRYDKGAWSECKDGQMTRIDKVKTLAAPTADNGSDSITTSDASCEPTRTINRKCNPAGSSRKSPKGQPNNNGKANKKERKSKEKGANTQQS